MTKPRPLGNAARELVNAIEREARAQRLILEEAKGHFRRGNDLAGLAMLSEAQVLAVSIENSAIRVQTKGR